MESCSSCKALSMAPTRLDIPAHLVRLPRDEAGASVRGSASIFRCNHCANRWQWAPPATWFLTVPVVRTPSAKERALRWWRHEILPLLQEHRTRQPRTTRRATPKRHVARID